MTIREARAEDVHRWVDDPDDRHYLRRHLRSGRGLLLFAFRDGVLAGHLAVRLAPAEEPELRSGLPGVPLLERLRVFAAHRRSGLARRLIDAAEARLVALGHRRVALGVDPGNHAAIRLYETLSFTVWRTQTLTTFREHVRDDGSTGREEDRCLVFVKNLPPPEGPR